MEVIDEDINVFKRIMKCPECGTEIIADHREDLG